MTSPTSLFLPPEVVFNILSRLPVKSLHRFKAVCKSWLRLIADPQFVAAHLQQSKKHPRILFLAERKGGHNSDAGTLFCYEEEHQNYAQLLQLERWHRLNPYHCDGLVLIYSQINIFVCNPSTRESVCLHRSHFSETSPGFGFDPSTNSYKVVRISETDKGSPLQCEVFTLGSDRAWRTVGRPPVCDMRYRSDAATVNGVVYWLSYVLNEEEWQLLAFDLRDESFRIIPIPQVDEVDDYWRRSRRFFLNNHEGRLCLISVSSCTPLREIWTLSVDDNKWSKSYSFECRELQYYQLCPMPVILPDERILFYGQDLYFYNTRNRGSGTIAMMDDDRDLCSFAIYAESMLSVGPGPAIDEIEKA